MRLLLTLDTLIKQPGRPTQAGPPRPGTLQLYRLKGKEGTNETINNKRKRLP